MLRKERAPLERVGGGCGSGDGCGREGCGEELGEWAWRR